MISARDSTLHCTSVRTALSPLLFLFRTFARPLARSLATGHAIAPIVDCHHCDKNAEHQLWSLEPTAYLDAYRLQSGHGNLEAMTLEDLGMSSWSDLSDGEEILITVDEGGHSRFFAARISMAGSASSPSLEYETSATALQESFKTIDLNDALVQVIIVPTAYIIDYQAYLINPYGSLSLSNRSQSLSYRNLSLSYRSLGTGAL